MKILFLSLDSFESYDSDNIYADILRAATEKGHEVVSLLPSENGAATVVEKTAGGRIIRLKTGQVTGNVNFIKKGINTLRLGGIYKKALKKYCKHDSFDLILYATPPITIYKAVKYAKKKTGAKTYLLLKDIFPQNAVDLGILKKSGLKGFIYRVFRKTERRYYLISDRIGCMSRRNAEYLAEHNPYIPAGKICVNPNSVDCGRIVTQPVDKSAVRREFSLPDDARIFVYGGNLGRPQNVPFIIECLKRNAEKSDRFFVISGGGSDYALLKNYFDEYSPSNMMLINGLPSARYDRLVSACDVGLIFLDFAFTIPNYPSRLLSYMKQGLPVIACTDESTDVGVDAEEGGFGWKCFSNDADKFTAVVDEACVSALTGKSVCALQYLARHFSAERSMEQILEFAMLDK